MKSAAIDGVELAYEITGEGDPAVFIHGALIADLFRPLMQDPALTSRYRLLNYHRRGYGGSSRVAEPVSLAKQASDCRSLLDYLGLERANIVGHSFGGAIALQLALDSPGVVSSLVLMEPALAIGTSGADYRASLQRGVARFCEEGAGTVVDAFLEARRPGYRGPLDAMLPGAFEQALEDAEATFGVDTPGFIAWDFDETDARRVNQPTLLVLGDKSNALWSRFGEVHAWMLGTLPHAEEFVLPNSTHFMQLDNPEGLAAGLSDFWARHPIVENPAGV